MCGAILFVLIGASLGYLAGAPIGGVVFLILFGIGMSLLIMSKELVFRPRSISFNDDGLLLELPLGRKRTIIWSNIKEIFAFQGNPGTLFGRIQRSGGVEEVNRAPVDLTYELAFRLRDEYERRFGDQVIKVWKHRLR